MGARRVIFADNGYDPLTHHPASSNGTLKYDVGFVGTFEADRAQLISDLGRAGISVTIHGNGWQQLRRTQPPGLTFKPAALAEDYAATISATRIDLGFLRKANRDLQTSRSVEIPACGGFMLAERTSEHQGMFREGVEAEFFEGFDELLAKVQEYLNDEPLRREVAAAGRQRCLNGHSYAARFATALRAAGIEPPAQQIGQSDK